MPSLEEYLSDLARQLYLDAPTKEKILEEVRSHLVESAGDFHRKGYGPQQSIALAIARFGEAEEVAKMMRQVYVESAPLSWGKIGLTILPGLFALAASWVVSARGLIPIAGLGLCVLLSIAGFMQERRLAAWSFPALGILIGIASLLALSLGPLLLLAVLAAMVALVVCQWRGLHIPRLGWVLLCLMILVSVAGGIVSASADRAPDKWIGFWTSLALSLVWGCVVLLPLAIGLPLARRSGLFAGLTVVAAEFVLVNEIFDPDYALGLWTSNQAIVKMVSVIPAVFFLVISVIWVLRSRSTRGQVLGLLLPAFIALVSAEVIGGTVRPYYSIDMWLTRGIGAAQFLIAMALAAVIYHWIERQGQAMASVHKEMEALAESSKRTAQSMTVKGFGTSQTTVAGGNLAG